MIYIFKSNKLLITYLIYLRKNKMNDNIMNIFKTGDINLINNNFDYIKNNYPNLDFSFSRNKDIAYYVLMLGDINLVERIIENFDFRLRNIRLHDFMVIYVPYSKYEDEIIQNDENFNNFIKVGKCTIRSGFTTECEEDNMDYYAYSCNSKFPQNYNTIEINRNFEETIDYFIENFRYSEIERVECKFKESYFVKFINERKFDYLHRLIELGLNINYDYTSENNLLTLLMKWYIDNSNENLDSFIKLVNLVMKKTDKINNIRKFYMKDVTVNNINELSKYFQIIDSNNIKNNIYGLVKDDVYNCGYVSTLTHYLNKKDYKNAELLISKGFEVNFIDKNGYSTFYNMILNRDLDGMNFMLKYDIKIDEEYMSRDMDEYLSDEMTFDIFIKDIKIREKFDEDKYNNVVDKFIGKIINSDNNYIIRDIIFLIDKNIHRFDSENMKLARINLQEQNENDFDEDEDDFEDF